MIIVTTVKKIKGQGEMQLISEKVFVRRCAVREISWLQRVATCRVATSDAREHPFLRRELTSESNISVCLRSDNSKGTIC